MSKRLDLALKHYLDYLQIFDDATLARKAKIERQTASRILRFVDEKKTALSAMSLSKVCRKIEKLAVAAGCDYSWDAPGWWMLKADDLLDILKMCELDTLYKMRVTLNGRLEVAKKILDKKQVKVTNEVLKKLCEATGSYPEEIAERYVRAYERKEMQDEEKQERTA